VNDVLDLLLRISGGVGLPGVVTYLLVQRRKLGNENELAERTMGATVAKADVGALEAHMLAVENAFRVERESKDRVIASLEERVTQVQKECDDRVSAKDREISQLRRQVSTLANDLQALQRQFGSA
jgi:uncharacterized protein (UPF0548 family)